MSGPSSEVGSAYAKIGLDSKDLDSGMNFSKSKFSSFCGDLEGKAKSTGSAIAGALKTAVVAGGVAAAGAATAGLMSFKDLEDAASSAASKSVDVNGKSVEQIKAQYDSLQSHVIEVSRQLGQATVFDPTDVASAFDALAGAGQNVANIGQKELLPFLDLAATDMKFGLGNTTELMMSYMNGFGLSMQDSGKMADMLTKGVNGSNASLETYLLAMREGGATAAGANMPLNEFLATVGKLSDHSITGAAAGDALKTAIMSLGSPSKAQTEALAKLGLTYDDVNPRTHNFIDTLALLKSRGADVIDFGNIFTQSSGAVMNWAAKDAAAIKALSGEISDSNGLAHAMAGLIMGSDKLKGSFEQAVGSTSDLFIALGQYLEPAAVAVLNAWTALVPKIEEFGEAIGNGDWGKVGDMITEGIEGGWKTLYPLGQQLYEKIRGVNWSGLGQYLTKGVISAWNGLKNLGGQLLGWFQSVDWGSIGQSILSSISGIGKSLYSSITSIDWAGVGTTILSGLQSALTFLEGVGQTIYSAIVSVKWAEIGTSILDGLKSIPAKIQSLFSEIDFGKAWDSLVSSASSATTSIYNYLNNIKWGDLGYQGGKALSSAIENAINTLSNIGTTISGYLKTASANAGSIGTDIGEKIKGGLASVSGWMDQAKAGFLVGWGDTGTKIGNLIKDGLTKGVDYAKTIYDNIYNGLKKWVETSGETISKLGKDAGATFLKGIGLAIYAGATASLYIWSQLQKVLTEAPKWIAIGIEAIGGFAQGFVQGALDTLADGVALGILLGVKAALSGLVDWNIPGVSDWAKSNMSPLDTEITRLKTNLTSIGDLHVEPSMDVDTEYVGGSDPSGLDGKTYSATLNVKTYTDSSGAPLGDVKGTGYMGYQAGASTPSVYNANTGYQSLGDYAKSLAKLGYDQSQITDKIMGLLASSNTARSTNNQPNIVLSDDALTGALNEAKPYIDAYKLAHKSAADVTVDAAKAAAKVETDGAKEETTTEKEAAKTSSGIWTQAAEQQNASLKSFVAWAQAAMVSGGNTISAALNSAAQNALTIGNSVASKFQGAGDAVKIAMDASTGKLTAYIGSAGDKLKGDADLSGSYLKTGGQNAQTALQSGSTQAKTTMQSGADGIRLSANHLGTQGQNAGNSLATGGSTAAGNLISGASSAARSISGAASSLASAVFNLNVGKWASGTVTSGPQLAMIGEDGAAHPEFVIPTKTKRWDLLLAAMRAYGIPGYAEGTSTGSAGAEATDAEEMRAYFGIKGLASMSKQVQKIINDLKNFFRISWGIIKAEGSTYWKQIETAITGEATTIRDGAWQAALDIRNTWISTNAQVLADTTTSYAAMWPTILPSLADVHDGTLATFADMDSQIKSLLEQMTGDTSTAFQTFKSNWDTVWSQMLADLQSTASEITSILQGISAQVSAISVNVSIGATGGGSYGGGSATISTNGGGVSSSISSAAQTFTDCLFEGFTDSCTGVIVNALKYTNPSGVTSYINPMTYLDNGGISNYQGGGSSYSSASSYQLPAIFRSAGGGVFDRPSTTRVAEEGIEMVLPTKLSRMFLSLADAGLGQGAQGAAASRIVIEDHTEHHWYLDGKEVTNAVMNRVKKQIQLRGGVPAI